MGSYIKEHIVSGFFGLDVNQWGQERDALDFCGNLGQSSVPGSDNMKIPMECTHTVVSTSTRQTLTPRLTVPQEIPEKILKILTTIQG